MIRTNKIEKQVNKKYLSDYIDKVEQLACEKTRAVEYVVVPIGKEIIDWFVSVNQGITFH